MGNIQRKLFKWLSNKRLEGTQNRMQKVKEEEEEEQKRVTIKFYFKKNSTKLNY